MPAKSFAGGWRSITKSSTSQSSRLAHTRRRSVAQRSFDAVATEGSVWTSGRNPIGRLFLCQPRRWKMRCTVFLLNPSRAATVRQPDESSSLIIALIDSAKRGYIFGAALTDLQYTVRGGIWNHWYSLTVRNFEPNFLGTQFKHRFTVCFLRLDDLAFILLAYVRGLARMGRRVEVVTCQKNSRILAEKNGSKRHPRAIRPYQSSNAKVNLRHGRIARCQVDRQRASWHLMLWHLSRHRAWPFLISNRPESIDESIKK